MKEYQVMEITGLPREVCISLLDQAGGVVTRAIELAYDMSPTKVTPLSFFSLFSLFSAVLFRRQRQRRLLVRWRNEPHGSETLSSTLL